MIRILLALALTIFIGQILPRALHSEWLYWAVTIPGTIGHEAMHWMFAFALQGDPGTFSIIPTFSGGQMSSLGHITFSPNWYNAASVALSPYLLVFPAAWYVLKASELNPITSPLYCWISACGFASLTPSPQDFSIAFSYPLSVLVAILIFYLFGRLFVGIIRRRAKEIIG